MVFLAFTVRSYLYSEGASPCDWIILEMLLRQNGIDASECLFAFIDGTQDVAFIDGTQDGWGTINLSQMIQYLNPPNRDGLLKLLDRPNLSILSTAWKSLASKFETTQISHEIHGREPHFKGRTCKRFDLSEFRLRNKYVNFHVLWRGLYISADWAVRVF